MAYNDGKLQAVALNTGGALDTAHPPTDREPGTLVEALDLNHRYWGPKVGPLATQRAWDATDKPAVGYDYFTFDGTNDYAVGYSPDDQFRDLGTQWTLDLFYTLGDDAYAAGQDSIMLYEWDLGYASPSTHIITLKVVLDNDGSDNFSNPVATITPTSARGTLGTARTIGDNLTGSGGAVTGYPDHVRVVRDGANAYLYYNGSLTQTITNLSATQPHQGVLSAIGGPQIGRGDGALVSPFKGVMYYACLRDGVYQTPIEHVIHDAPHSPSVKSCVLGVAIEDGTREALWDVGRYGVHATVAGGLTGGGSTAVLAPLLAPVQGLGTVTLRSGRTMSLVVVGGRVYRSYAT